jgi:hypothetical protein
MKKWSKNFGATVKSLPTPESNRHPAESGGLFYSMWVWITAMGLPSLSLCSNKSSKTFGNTTKKYSRGNE